MSATGDVLRPLGTLEKLYTARQVLGIYHSVIVTASYDTLQSPTHVSLNGLFCAAIPGLLERHHILCCYVEDQNTPQPRLRRLNKIKVEDVLVLRDYGQDEDLARVLQQLHDQTWPLEPRPLWKLVLKRAADGSKLHVAFVFHHVIGDGLSGIAVHRSLIEEIERVEVISERVFSSSPDPIDTPASLSLISPVEERMTFPLSWAFLLKQLCKEYTPQWLRSSQSPSWAGLSVQTLEKYPYRSRIRIIIIAAEDLAILLKGCKKQGISLTGLLTAAVVASLAAAVPTASSFIGSTPYSLRRETGTSKDDMAVEISAFETFYPTRCLDQLRGAPDNFTRITHMYGVARNHHVQMQSELAQCPRDNIVGLLPYVSDYIGFYRNKFGNAREATFEVSNLGVFRNVLQSGSVNSMWKPESMTFSQGATPVGPALNVNCASVASGSLNIAVSWQESVVEEAIIEKLIKDLRDLPSDLKEGLSNLDSSVT